jgi:hypothetical protein
LKPNDGSLLWHGGLTWCSVFYALGFTVSLSNAAPAIDLPTDEQVTGIVKLCAIGRVESIQGDVEGKIQIWKRDAAAKGNASISDLGAIPSTVNKGATAT